MKLIIRLLKINVAIFLYAICLPYTAIVWILSTFLMIPLGFIFYLFSGDIETSFDKSADFCMDTLWCDVGLAPEVFVSEKLLHEEAY